MYCLFASPLMMLLLASVDCSANFEKFKSEPSMTNRVCPADRRLFEEQAVSRIACMGLASQLAGCMAVAYNKERHMCYGCDTVKGEFQTLECTMFYSRPNAIPDGFEFISGYILMVSRQNTGRDLTYDQAHSACAVHSASLVRIDSPEKQTAIRNHLSTLSGNRYYWIQLRRNTIDGLWKFDDGTPVPMTDDFWSQGRYNTPKHDCGVMFSDYSFYWSNGRCTDSLGYICELV